MDGYVNPKELLQEAVAVQLAKEKSDLYVRDIDYPRNPCRGFIGMRHLLFSWLRHKVSSDRGPILSPLGFVISRCSEWN